MSQVTRAIPAARRDLLEALMRRVESGVEALASDLGYSASAVRSLLVALTADGLVSWTAARQPRGRPAHLFRLTDSGERLFPQAYSRALTSTLAFMAEEAPELLPRMFERWRRDTRLPAEQLAGLAGAGSNERAAAISEAQSAAGVENRIESVDDSEASIVIVHCPILEAARKFPALCESELEWIRENSGATVERTHHRLAGQSTCVYLLRTTARN